METVITERIEKDFYLTNDVVTIAKSLIGKVIHTYINGIHTAALITETEAYAGVTDKASHAYAGRRTQRTEIMYEEGGIAYVYFCYGMHYLFNVVTNKKDVPHAVLVRSIYPLINKEEMLKRANKKIWDKNTGVGPGKVTKLLGIDKDINGITLLGDRICLSHSNINIDGNDIHVSKRIGVDYAAEDALLPWRFILDYFVVEKKYK